MGREGRCDWRGVPGVRRVDRGVMSRAWHRCAGWCGFLFFLSSRRRHTRLQGDWSSDVCSSDLGKWGPVISSQALWYRPAVKWVVGAMLLLCCYWFVRHGVWNKVIKRLVRENALPIFSLAIFVAAMVISTNADRKSVV